MHEVLQGNYTQPSLVRTLNKEGKWRHLAVTVYQLICGTYPMYACNSLTELG